MQRGRMLQVIFFNHDMMMHMLCDTGALLDFVFYTYTHIYVYVYVYVYVYGKRFFIKVRDLGHGGEGREGRGGEGP